MEQRYRNTLPAALVDLSGPAHGTVHLPLRVAWSGQTAFDLNRDLLVSQWPVLRTLIGRTVRGVWESAFPELCGGQPAAP